MCMERRWEWCLQEYPNSLPMPILLYYISYGY
jgi:hypothetical protein